MIETTGDLLCLVRLVWTMVTIPVIRVDPSFERTLLKVNDAYILC